MTPARSKIESGIWQAPGRGPLVEYSRSVLIDIVKEVVDAHATYLSGGFEVGGVLFGVREGRTVRILSSRPLLIEPPRPSFMLSSQDEAKLRELLARAEKDPELGGLAPVGWYHSHTRSEIFLSQSDTDLYDRYFGEPWQVAMVLRPSEGEPVRVGFFFREEDGYIRTDSSYQEFAVDAAPTDRKAGPWTTLEAPEIPLPPPDELEPLPGDRHWRLLIGALVLALASVFGYLGYRIYNLQPPISASLQISGWDGDLTISWNPKAAILQHAPAVFLRVVDGDKEERRQLTLRELKFGHASWKARSGRVDAALEIERSFGRPKRESAVYLEHPLWRQPSPATNRALAEVQEAQKIVDGARSDLEQQRKDLAGLEGHIAELEAAKVVPPKQFTFNPAPKPTAAARELPAAPEVHVARPVAVATPAVGQGIAQAIRPPAPTPTAPAVTIPIPSPGLINGSSRPVAAPTPAAVVATIPARYAGPLTGKFLWTGELPRDGMLTIEGARASRGYVNGELPGIPVRIGAYPADVNTGGIRVLTQNPRYSAGRAQAEAPAAHNGWNRTEYVFDPKSARELIVMQLPDPQSSWKKVVVRAGNRKVSAVVIEWEAVTQ